MEVGSRQVITEGADSLRVEAVAESGTLGRMWSIVSCRMGEFMGGMGVPS